MRAPSLARSLAPSVAELHVTLPSLDLDDDAAHALLQASARRAADSDLSVVLPLPPLRPGGAAEAEPLFVPLAASVDEACDAAYELLVQAHGGRRGAAAAQRRRDFPMIPLPARRDVRLRCLDPVTRRATDSYSHLRSAGSGADADADAPTSLRALCLGPSASVVLEVRLAAAAIEVPWPDWDRDAAEVRLLLWPGPESAPADGAGEGEGESGPGLRARVLALALLAEQGPEAAAAFLQPHTQAQTQAAQVLGAAGAGLAGLLSCDARALDQLPPMRRPQQACVSLPSLPRPASGETLLTACVDTVLEPRPGDAFPRTVHCVVLPGGLPSLDDVASGQAAARMRLRASPPPASCLPRGGASGGSAAAAAPVPVPGGLRVLSFPIADADCDALALLLRRDCGLQSGDDVIVLAEREGDAAGQARTEGAGEGEGEGDGAELAALLPRLRAIFSASTLRVHFNRLAPLSAAPAQLPQPPAALTITARRDETLGALKQRMVALLNGELGSASASAASETASEPPSASSAPAFAPIDAGAVHLRRNPRAPQLRASHEARSLRDNDVGDGAQLLLGHGAPLPDGVVVVRCLAWQAVAPAAAARACEAAATAATGATTAALAGGGPRAKAAAAAAAVAVSAASAVAAAGGALALVCTLPLALTARVGALRKALHRELLVQEQEGRLPAFVLPASAEGASRLKDATPQHVRLRARPAAALGAAGAILRDKAVLRQALGGGGGGGGDDEDERDVVMLLLPQAEAVGKDDLIVRVVELQAAAADAREARLGAADDLFLPKATTLAALCASLHPRAPAAVRLAKHSAFGPVLTAWEATHKAAFLGPFAAGAGASEAEGEGAALVSGPPLGLRDGYTLLWRCDAVPAETSAVPLGRGSASAAATAAPALPGGGENKENAESAGGPDARPTKPWLRKGARAAPASELLDVCVVAPRRSGAQPQREVGPSIRVKPLPGAVGAERDGAVIGAGAELEVSAPIVDV